MPSAEKKEWMENKTKMLDRAQVEGTGGSDKGQGGKFRVWYRERDGEDKLNRGDIRRRVETEGSERV